MCLMTQLVLEWTELHVLEITVHFIPGKKNVVANKLSLKDQVISMEWSHHPQICKLCGKWQRLLVDLFKTNWNARLPICFSLNSLVWKEDTLQHCWDHLDIYAFPLFIVIHWVINQVRSSSILAVILITPLWPQQEWFTDLLSLLVAKPLQLHIEHMRKFQNALGIMSLHAWKLSRDVSNNETFRQKL